ncbi:LIM domain-binding protein 3b isoform X3 [Anarrhichthys ocellatus]|uniref:LIM domain-binding protein 3b isoform X3 n=1 Tax=Anarrhichthys ocellatus TaxID=433405 RepID=UPI0012EDCD1E|nr:LIM domain-binding protein 3-like isoform X3 [Anarrhichthys ocellatus]
MTTYTVTLNGPAPWGFRLQGGKDFNMPLTISRITPGSKAVGGSLSQGDIISAIDGVSTDGMTHMEAQNKIKSGATKLSLTMQKSRRAAAFSTPRMESPMPVIAHQKELEKVKEEVGPKHFGEEVEMVQAVSYDIFQEKKPSERNLFQVPKKDPELLSTPIKAPASSTPSAVSSPGQWMQYNSPVGLYSPDTLREMMQMQGKLGQGSAASRGVSSLGGALPIKDSVVDCASPVYQAVIRPGENQTMAEWARRAATLQSKSFRMLAHITGTEYLQDPDEEALQKSRDKFESEMKGPRFAKLKNWHQGLSSQILNVQV